MPFQFFNWLHADFMGNMKDSILSLWLFEISSISAPKMIYINVCEITNLYADILHYLAHETLLMLDTYCILDNSASKKDCITRHLITGSLGTWYHSALEHWFTRHLISLGSWTLVHLALDITRHLNTCSLGTWYHLALDHAGSLGTRLWLSSSLLLGMYGEKWLSVVTLNCQN